MTSKQRSYLKGLAMTMDPILQIGKSSLTPELTKAAEEALNARELIKIHVLKNCADNEKDVAQVLAERDPVPGGAGDRKNDRFIPSGKRGEGQKDRSSSVNVRGMENML